MSPNIISTMPPPLPYVSPPPDVLLAEMETQLQTTFPPSYQQLAAVQQTSLFRTPSRLSREFPHIKLKITTSNGKSYDIEALLDSGANSTYVSPSFVQDHDIPTRKLRYPLHAYNVDDSPNKTAITHEAQFTTHIQGHKSTEWYYVTNIGAKTMIIGFTWLRSHNPVIDWRSGKIEFSRCPYSCDTQFTSSQRLQNLLDKASITTEYPTSEALCNLVHDREGRHEINAKNYISTELAIEAFKNKKVLTLEDIKAGPFADFLDVFGDEGYQEMPPHRRWDHKIDLIEGWEDKLWKPKVYPLGYDEQKELDEFIDENLKNGRIRISESPVASSVFFIPRKGLTKDGKRRTRMVIDYRKLNAITKKNAYPLPRIDDLLIKWKGCKYFSALDVRQGYYNIRIREGDEWKTAFITSRGLYESLVMTFGLCNAPATFQTMMDSIFVTYVRRGDTGAFIDDVGIATASDPTGVLSDEDFHIKACRDILHVFRKNNLYLAPEKCLFLQKEIPYLGHIVSGEGIRPDPVKLDGIAKWPVPTTVKELRSFLGFLNYYRRYVFGFSEIARPLNDLLKKTAKWIWTDEQQKAYQALRDALISKPSLAHPNHEKPYLLETDASKYAYGAILSQKQDDDTWKPVGYLSRSLSSNERNYDTHDRELLAIIRALEEFRHFLMGAKHPVMILTDHNNLRYFRTKQIFNARQARWAEFLTKFDIDLRYRPGKQSGAPDLLSRRADHDTHGTEDSKEMILLPDSLFAKVDQKIAYIDHPSEGESTEKTVYIAQMKDPLIEGFNKLLEGTPMPDGWSRPERLFLYRGKIYIPPSLRQTFFRNLHSSPAAAHPGRDATLFSIRKDYYWPGMRNDIEEWVRNCDVCQRVKVFPKKPHGELKPIDPIPRFWGVVTSDLITGLPPCKGYDSIWTATDKRSKMIHIAPTKSTLDSEGLYHLFLNHIWKLHGTADKHITDRGPQYSSRFAKDANKNLQIETAMSTAYHPQTDGQSERTNQEVEQALRSVVNFHQNDWVDWLPIIEFALNNRFKKALGTTPFYANYGFHPQIGSLPRIDTPIVSVENFVLHLQQVQKDTEISLQQAAIDMKRFYDRHRGKTPEFALGQKVLLDNADLAINRPSRKLAERRSGPFKIVKKVGTHAYQLELPLNWKNVHPVFHVSKLYAYKEDPENPNFNPPPPDIVEGEPEWEVETILDSKWTGNHLMYLVKWLGWPNSENSWEPERNLVNSEDSIKDFHQSHPGAPQRLPDGSKTGQSLTKKR